MNKELERLVTLFNVETLKKYANKNKEDYTKYSPDRCEEIIGTSTGCIDPGAIYKWPKESGGKVHIIGFGLIELNNRLWFLAGFNSKSLGRPRVEKLYPEEVLKMLEWGEVEFLGNIFDKSFRESYDIERLSLAIIGFSSLVFTSKMQKNVSVEHIMDDLENGKMTMDDLLSKCRGVTGENLLI